METIKKFLIASLLGGLIVMISVALPISLFSALLDVISIFTAPLAKALVVLVGKATVSVYVAKTLEILVALALCFVVGIFVKTRIGRALENTFLKRIIVGYSLLKESLVQFSDLLKQRKVFISAAIFYPYGLHCSEKIGFISSYPRDGYATCIELKAGINGFGDGHTLPDRLIFPLPGVSFIEVVRIAAVGGAGTKIPGPDTLESLETLVAKGKRP